MAVRGDRPVAERPRIDHGPDLGRRIEFRAEDEVAAFGKALAHGQPRRFRLQCFVLRGRRAAQQPARAIVQRARFQLEVAAPEEQRPEAERRAIGGKAGAPLEAQETAVVGVAEHRHVAAHVHHRRDEIQHRFDARLVVGRETLAVRPAGEQTQEQYLDHALLVPGRMLAVHAVGRVLRQRFALDDGLRLPAPFAHLRPVRPGERGDEQARGFADQVVVGGGMRREPVPDEMRVLVNRAQPAALQVRVHQRLHQLPRHRPVGKPDARLERARPVRPESIRAGDEPALELPGERFVVVALPGERVRLRERHELLVAVRLPQVLDVADPLRVAVVEELAVDERRLDAGLRIAVPARRHADVQLAQRQQIEATVRDGVRRGEIRRRIGAVVAMHPSFAARSAIRCRHNGRAHESRALGARAHRAQRAMRDLQRRHAAQAVQPPAQRALYARREVLARVRCQISRFSSVHSVCSWLRLPARCSSIRRSSTAPSQ